MILSGAAVRKYRARGDRCSFLDAGRRRPDRDIDRRRRHAQYSAQETSRSLALAGLQTRREINTTNVGVRY